MIQVVWFKRDLPASDHAQPAGGKQQIALAKDCRTGSRDPC
jgi:hypothetical protein